MVVKDGLRVVVKVRARVQAAAAVELQLRKAPGCRKSEANAANDELTNQSLASSALAEPRRQLVDLATVRSVR